MQAGLVVPGELSVGSCISASSNRPNSVGRVPLYGPHPYRDSGLVSNRDCIRLAPNPPHPRVVQVGGLAAAGLPTRGVRVVAGGGTPTVAALFEPHGDLGCCVADVELLNTHLDETWVRRFADDIKAASVVLVDGAYPNPESERVMMS